MVHPYISPYTVWCGGGEPAVLENILDSSESVGDASLAESSIHGGEEQGSGEEESSERNQQGDPASNMADADTAEMTAEQLRAEVMKARQERVATRLRRARESSRGGSTECTWGQEAGGAGAGCTQCWVYSVMSALSALC